MRLFLLVFLFISTLVHADSWLTKVHALLPAPLKELPVGKATIADAQKTLGKASLIEGNKYYWEQNHFKYAVVLTFDKKVLSSIHYTFTRSAPKIDSLDISLNEKNLQPYNTKYLRIQEKTGEIVIDPIQKTIYSVKIQ